MQNAISKKFSFRIGAQVGALVLGTSMFAMGCGSAPIHTENTAASIRAAREVGAASIPEAAFHLQLAQEEMDRAKMLAKDGEDERASSILKRAEVDAELAVKLSHSHAEKAAADKAMARLQQLRQENP